MTKNEIDSSEKVLAWLATPGPAVFQGQDLRAVSAAIANKPLAGCVFLGCLMEPLLAQAAVEARCLVVPPQVHLPFNPFRPSLYTPDELFQGFDSEHPESYRDSLDWRIYDSYIDSSTKDERPTDLDAVLFRRLHDASVADALHDLLDLKARKRVVAIMGGHDVLRTAPSYFAVARLAQHLAMEGYLVVTGGGPGLMEAANLGAYTAGFPDRESVLTNTLEAIGVAPRYTDAHWLSVAFAARRSLGAPADPQRSRNVGVPTWFYGHEPPNVFPTHVAKYFENSIREEGLLSIALGGVIFAEGNAGTVQEIFQDACQNYYRTYSRVKSPMVLLGTEYWNPSTPVPAGANDRRKPAYPLLAKLAAEKGFSDYLLLTDDLTAVVPFLKSRPPV